MPQSTQCLFCKHYQGLWQCDAYPEKIPVEIATGEHDHTKPFKGDQGVRFEPIPEEKE